MLKTIYLFSLVTPLGIILGSVLSEHLAGNSWKLAESVFYAIASGTFLYIAFFELCTVNGNKATQSKWQKYSYFVLGLLLMSAIAFWV